MTAKFARTFSATTRHIIKPDDEKRTLCGGWVYLSEFWTNEDGSEGRADSIRVLPPCERCAKSATKRGITLD